MTAGRRVPALAAAFAALFAEASCVRPAPPALPGELRYVLGEPYALGGVWSYPREEYGLAESGLAAVLPDARRGQRTADGEIYDPSALTAAHRTLQLPVVLRVWNLDTGRELRVRVNDRGPEQPGRVVGRSRRAAELLGARPGEPTRVRIAVEPEMSRATAEGLPGAEGPRLAIATAPVAVVERELLAPPPGARVGAGPVSGGALRVPVGFESAAARARPPRLPQPLRLPEEVVERGGIPSRLSVDAGTFHQRDLAERRAANVGGQVEPVGSGRHPQFRVRSGPYATAAAVDRALEAAFRRGIPDATIVLD